MGNILAFCFCSVTKSQSFGLSCTSSLLGKQEPQHERRQSQFCLNAVCDLIPELLRYVLTALFHIPLDHYKELSDLALPPVKLSALYLLFPADIHCSGVLLVVSHRVTLKAQFIHLMQQLNFLLLCTYVNSTAWGALATRASREYL